MAASKGQAANKARLKRMHAGAKKYMKAHPSAKYATALKEAGRKEKIGARKASPALKRAKAAHATEGKALRALGSMTVSQVTAKARRMKADQLGWLMVQIQQASTAGEKKKLLKKKAKLLQDIKALS